MSIIMATGSRLSIQTRKRLFYKKCHNNPNNIKKTVISTSPNSKKKLDCLNLKLLIPFCYKNHLISIFVVFLRLPLLLTSHFVTEAHFFFALVSETTSETDNASVRGRDGKGLISKPENFFKLTFRPSEKAMNDATM